MLQAVLPKRVAAQTATLTPTKIAEGGETGAKDMKGKSKSTLVNACLTQTGLALTIIENTSVFKFNRKGKT